MLTFTLVIPFDHFQFASIHGPNIPASYAILLFTTLDLASITSHITSGYCFCFGSIPSFFLELFLHWSPGTYWAPTDLGSSTFSEHLSEFIFSEQSFRSDRMWATGEGNGKPLQYSYLENPMNSMRRQNDRILKGELPRVVSAICNWSSVEK